MQWPRVGTVDGPVPPGLSELDWSHCRWQHEESERLKEMAYHGEYLGRLVSGWKCIIEVSSQEVSDTTLSLFGPRSN